MPPTTRFDPGDIVHAPFPHVERAVVVRRPALVLGILDTGVEAVGRLAWVLMITSAARPAWRNDVPIPAAERQGLIIPSRVRTAKVATIAIADAVRIGRLEGPAWEEVRSHVFGTLDVR